ncbi:MAG: orotidine-5'-phosphate decarboxylase, partial [Actinobacteria bacterium]|nr:orotidine-5'-phosphate decarboxylase [Actinomycetota bacterium]
LGVRWLTVHTAGGEAMLRAAVEGLAAGSAGLEGPPPGVLGVTVLTSDELNDPDLLTERTALAAATGCAGIICAAPDLPLTAPWAEQLTRVVPGTRLPGAETHDQIRVTDPRTALNNGADLLVIGRGVTATPEPILAAAELVGHLLG